MVRKLKYHEKKLLKKVDFISWEIDNNLNEVKVMKKYYIQKREDYTKYNKMSRGIRTFAEKLKSMDPKSSTRAELTAELLTNLEEMGLIPTKQSLELCEKVTATSFCRRRLPVVMVRSNMAETLKAAVTFIEAGHVRVGPNVTKDPAFLVTRKMENFVTWSHTSSIRKKVMAYNEMRDDFELS